MEEFNVQTSTRSALMRHLVPMCRLDVQMKAAAAVDARMQSKLRFKEEKQQLQDNQSTFGQMRRRAQSIAEVEEEEEEEEEEDASFSGGLTSTAKSRGWLLGAPSMRRSMRHKSMRDRRLDGPGRSTIKARFKVLLLEQDDATAADAEAFEDMELVKISQATDSLWVPAEDGETAAAAAAGGAGGGNTAPYGLRSILVNPLDDDDIWLEDSKTKQQVQFVRSGSNAWVSRTGSLRHMLHMDPYTGQGWLGTARPQPNASSSLPSASSMRRMTKLPTSYADIEARARAQLAGSLVQQSPSSVGKMRRLSFLKQPSMSKPVVTRPAVDSGGIMPWHQSDDTAAAAAGNERPNGVQLLGSVPRDITLDNGPQRLPALGGGLGAEMTDVSRSSVPRRGILQPLAVEASQQSQPGGAQNHQLGDSSVHGGGGGGREKVDRIFAAYTAGPLAASIRQRFQPAAAAAAAAADGDASVRGGGVMVRSAGGGNDGLRSGIALLPDPRAAAASEEVMSQQDATMPGMPSLLSSSLPQLPPIRAARRQLVPQQSSSSRLLSNQLSISARPMISGAQSAPPAAPFTLRAAELQAGEGGSNNGRLRGAGGAGGGRAGRTEGVGNWRDVLAARSTSRASVKV